MEKTPQDKVEELAPVDNQLLAPKQAAGPKIAAKLLAYRVSTVLQKRIKELAPKVKILQTNKDNAAQAVLIEAERLCRIQFAKFIESIEYIQGVLPSNSEAHPKLSFEAHKLYDGSFVSSVRYKTSNSYREGTLLTGKQEPSLLLAKEKEDKAEERLRIPRLQLSLINEYNDNLETRAQIAIRNRTIAGKITNNDLENLKREMLEKLADKLPGNGHRFIFFGPVERKFVDQLGEDEPEKELPF